MSGFCLEQRESVCSLPEYEIILAFNTLDKSGPFLRSVVKKDFYFHMMKPVRETKI
jgi:hypothetical protein